MSKMKELYEKVAGDRVLQAKFEVILNRAEKAGEDETGKKLLAFAKEAGFDVTVDEIKSFFNKLNENRSAELSDSELDAVAGGKGTWNSNENVGWTGWLH